MSILRPLIILANGDNAELGAGFADFSTRVFESDFSGNLDSFFGTFNSGAGSSTQVNVNAIQDSYGVLLLNTGTTATGTAGIHTGAAMTLLGGVSTHIISGKFRVPVLSTAAQRHTFRAGLGNNVTVGADPTDGIYIRLVDNLNTGRIQLVCRRASAEAVFNSTTTILANTWYQFAIVINPALTSAALYVVSGTGSLILEGSVITAANFPLTSTVLGWFTHVQKSIGTTTSQLQLDKVAYDLN